jgi:hypothetical protein
VRPPRDPFRVVGADHRERRRVEIGNRRAFAEKLRVHRETEVLAGAFSAGLLNRGTGQCLSGPRKNRAADDDRVPLRLLLERLADLRADALDVAEVQIPVELRRRADAYQ